MNEFFGTALIVDLQEPTQFKTPLALEAELSMTSERTCFCFPVFRLPLNESYHPLPVSIALGSNHGGLRGQMKTQVYFQLLAPQLFLGASSAWLFAWSHDENAPVLPRQTGVLRNRLEGRSPAPEPTSPPPAFKAPRKDSRVLKRASQETCGFRNGNPSEPTFFLPLMPGYTASLRSRILPR